MAAAVLTAASSCSRDAETPQPPEQAPAQSPFSGVPPGLSVDDHALPLLTSGPDGVSFLRSVADSTGADADLEQGVRLAFCADRGLRDYPAAVRLLEAASQNRPAPGVFRALAWARSHADPALDPVSVYARVFELSAHYGPAHYDLAFLLCLRNPDAGRAHFEQAVSAGVEDVRRLGKRFYRES